MAQFLPQRAEFVYPLDDPPDYEPAPERSLASLARAAGREPTELMYELLLRDNGHQMLLFAINGYAEFNLDYSFEMLQRDDTVLGLGDGGARVGLLCDASYPTLLLGHWGTGRAIGSVAVASRSSTPCAN